MWFVIVVWPVVLVVVMDLAISANLREQYRLLFNAIRATSSDLIALHAEVDRLQRLVDQHEGEKQSRHSYYD